MKHLFAPFLVLLLGVGQAAASSQMSDWLMDSPTVDLLSPDDGYNVPVLETESERKLAELKAKAAAGDVDAMLRYGSMLLYGQTIAKNENEGINWLNRAAIKGSKQACLYLARHYNLKAERSTSGGNPQLSAESAKYAFLGGEPGLPAYYHLSDQTTADGKRRAEQWAAQNKQTVPVSPK